MKEIRRIPDFKRDITGRKKRNIPVSAIFKIWISDVLNIIGVFFFVFGAVFVLIFFPFQSIFSESATEKDPAVEGKISMVQGTNASINEEQVYKYTYTYNVYDGADYEGVGYATGELFDEGDDVVVYYRQRNPQISMVEGLRKSEFGGGIGIVVLIFPLIGLVMLFFGTRKTIRSIGVLKVGELAKGKLVNKEATNTSINEQKVYKMTFEFTAKDGKVYRAIAKTHKTYNLEDDEEEQLFYDPHNPENAVLLDILPPAVKKYLLKQNL
jgi:hypothetical protein